MPNQYTAKTKPRKNIEQLSSLLMQLDPDIGYRDWKLAMMVILYQTGGSEEGFDLVNRWSRNGVKYRSERDVRSQWKGIDPDYKTPVGIRTLLNLINK